MTSQGPLHGRYARYTHQHDLCAARVALRETRDWSLLVGLDDLALLT